MPHFGSPLPWLSVPITILATACHATEEARRCELAPGDLTAAQLMVGGNSAWLARLEKSGTPPLEVSAAIPAASFVTPLQPGDFVSDTR